MTDLNLEKLLQAVDFAVETGSFDKRNIIENADNVCVFGLGKYFEDAFIKQNVRERFRVNMLCDNNRERLDVLAKDERYSGLKMITPDELPENTAVIFMLGDPRSAIKQFKEIIPIEGVFRLITYNDMALDDTMNGNRSREWFRDNKEAVIKAYEMLADEESKRIFVNIICNRIAPHLSEYDYDELATFPQYFPKDILSFSQNESFVDCGAFDGDTVKAFLETVDNKFDKIYSFELDRENFDDLKKNVSEYGEDISLKIECINSGVWNENKTISYGRMSSSDSFSIFNTRESELASVVKLDDCLKDKKITMIKMDIEGAEMNALNGAENIIKTQKPKMAICVYHRIEDIWEIPLYLKKIVPEYKISIRHHANYWVSETVCYAYID